MAQAFYFVGTTILRAHLVQACVSCGSAAARHLQQELFSGSFPLRAAMMAAPFPILLLAAYAASQWLSLASWKRSR